MNSMENNDKEIKDIKDDDVATDCSHQKDTKEYFKDYYQNNVDKYLVNQKRYRLRQRAKKVYDNKPMLEEVLKFVANEKKCDIEQQLNDIKNIKRCDIIEEKLNEITQLIKCIVKKENTVEDTVINNTVEVKNEDTVEDTVEKSYTKTSKNKKHKDMTKTDVLQPVATKKLRTKLRNLGNEKVDLK